MGLDEFKLCVDDQYFSGRLLSGHVRIVCGTNLTNINHIQVKIIGFAHVRWQETERRRNRRGVLQNYEQTYESHNDLVSNKSIIHTGEILEGQHDFPFEFELPMDLPCSFEGRYGQIRYYVEAKLDRSGIFKSHKRQRKYITVLSLVDLNKMPGSEQPITVFRDKEFANNCCCIDGGYVNLKLKLPRSCFAPGEYLPITVEIENHSDRTITSTLARLVMDERVYESAGKSANNSHIILARYGDKIKGGKSETISEAPLCSKSIEYGCCTSKSVWTQESTIPILPPSTIERYNFCHIIKCFYSVQFKIFVRGSDRPFISIDIPITIGSIPLRQVRSCLRKRPDSSHTEKGPQNLESSAPPNSRIDDINDLPPPSYSEAIMIDNLPSNITPRPNDTKDTHANWDFKPKYPIWNMEN